MLLTSNLRLCLYCSVLSCILCKGCYGEYNANHFHCAKCSIQPFSIPTSSVQGCRGAAAYLQWSLGKRQSTPWTGHQFTSQGNTETHRTNNHAHTHSHLRAIERDQLT
ncbi:hypothetical protein AMECASPLE_012764 [Ameca splendens]|uniref:Secreted protein n=1 Tax=Ameca splendens TaxID=208324 RepID=A0ABV0Y158_9TELE